MSEMVNTINELKEQVKIMNQNGQTDTEKIEKANCITKSSSDVVKELVKILAIQTNTMSDLQNVAVAYDQNFYGEGGWMGRG